jgi:hypothetical protein
VFLERPMFLGGVLKKRAKRASCSYKLCSYILDWVYSTLKLFNAELWPPAVCIGHKYEVPGQGSMCKQPGIRDIDIAGNSPCTRLSKEYCSCIKPPREPLYATTPG